MRMRNFFVLALAAFALLAFTACVTTEKSVAPTPKAAAPPLQTDELLRLDRGVTVLIIKDVQPKVEQTKVPAKYEAQGGKQVMVEPGKCVTTITYNEVTSVAVGADTTIRERPASARAGEPIFAGAPSGGAQPTEMPSGGFPQPPVVTEPSVDPTPPTGTVATVTAEVTEAVTQQPTTPVTPTEPTTPAPPEPTPTPPVEDKPLFNAFIDYIRGLFKK